MLLCFLFKQLYDIKNESIISTFLKSMGFFVSCLIVLASIPIKYQSNDRCYFYILPYSKVKIYKVSSFKMIGVFTGKLFFLKTNLRKFPSKNTFLKVSNHEFMLDLLNDFLQYLL